MHDRIKQIECVLLFSGVYSSLMQIISQFMHKWEGQCHVYRGKMFIPEGDSGRDFLCLLDERVPVVRSVRWGICVLVSKLGELSTEKHSPYLERSRDVGLEVVPRPLWRLTTREKELRLGEGWSTERKSCGLGESCSTYWPTAWFYVVVICSARFPLSRWPWLYHLRFQSNHELTLKYSITRTIAGTALWDVLMRRLGNEIARSSDWSPLGCSRRETCGLLLVSNK